MNIVQVNRQYRLEGRTWKVERYPDGSIFLDLTIELGVHKSAIKLFESFILPPEVGEQIIERFEKDIKRLSGITIKDVTNEHTVNGTAGSDRDSDS